MMTKIKICGLTRAEDIFAVNQYLPDCIGFVFAESLRRVTEVVARRLKDELDPRISAVGVFVNEPIASIVELCRKGIIEAVQLHGDEDKAYIKSLRQELSCPVIKAVRVQNTDQIRQAQELPCDQLLLDTYHVGQYGGSGKSFEHRLIPELNKPYFLAGGLNLTNVVPAIREYHPYGVDISSGVETEGLKDQTKIKQIIAAIRELSEKKGKKDYEER